MNAYLIVSKQDQQSELTFPTIKQRKIRWTATRACRPGDLGFFYFGAPREEISAVGLIESVPDDEEGPFDWTERDKVGFCDFYPIRSLSTPLSFKLGARGTVLRVWYKKKPLPKQPPPSAARGAGIDHADLCGQSQFVEVVFKP